VEESMEKAYEMALSMRRKEAIYLAGSLYFVGSLKKYLKGE
jgi:folylpolyglutamate synthase/dihydropteroate synthase